MVSSFAAPSFVGVVEQRQRAEEGALLWLKDVQTKGKRGPTLVSFLQPSRSEWGSQEGSCSIGGVFNEGFLKQVPLHESKGEGKVPKKDALLKGPCLLCQSCVKEAADILVNAALLIKAWDLSS